MQPNSVFATSPNPAAHVVLTKVDAVLEWLDRTKVMQHLGVLEKARLIISKKEGRCRWNYLDVAPIQRIHERWIKAYAMPSAGMLNKLQRDLEDS